MIKPDLHSAIQRLKGFRAEVSDEDPVNGEGGLTGADLDVLIQHCEATEDMVSIRYVEDLNDLAKSVGGD